MPFDPATFEAEVALKLIPTERLPSVAQDALEVGFDGPHVLRMAILEPVAGWAIDQALPPMMEELGLHLIAPEEAALRLVRQRARRILETGENPLPSMPYFYRLLVAADYPDELYELAYFDDEDSFYSSDEEKLRFAREALEELLSPELRQKRLAERKAAWEQEQARIKSEWPLRTQLSQRTRSAEGAIHRKDHLHAATSLDRSCGMDLAWLGMQFVAHNCHWLRSEYAVLVRFACVG